MPPNLDGFFMVRSYYPSECHADYFDFERIEAIKPAIEACGISTLSQSPLLGFFFFQAEDGIRYYKVTGVQTCALPICPQPSDRGRGRLDPISDDPFLHEFRVGLHRRRGGLRTAPSRPIEDGGRLDPGIGG